MLAAGGAAGQGGAAGSPLDFGDAPAVVLFFIASDCPVSNRTLPEMRRVEREFAPRGVRFWFVYPNVTETAAGLRAHEAAYGLRGNVLTDAGRRFAKLTGAAVTPEAAILVPQGGRLHTVYLGRIDDRYLSLGTERPSPTRHDLEDSLTAALAGRAVPAPGGPPVGCSFVTER
jgi:hypothetical protein